MAVNTKTTDVLLVEDNPAEAKLVISAFKKCNPGKEIKWLTDGEQALQYIMSGEAGEGHGKAKSPLLLLLDLKLPKISGFELLKRIKEGSREKTMDIIVITGSESEFDMAQSYCYGVKNYMRKEIVCGNCIKMLSGQNGAEVEKAFKNAYKD